MESERSVWDVYIRDREGRQVILCTCLDGKALGGIVATLAQEQHRGPGTVIIERREEIVNDQS